MSNPRRGELNLCWTDSERATGRPNERMNESDLKGVIGEAFHGAAQFPILRSLLPSGTERSGLTTEQSDSGCTIFAEVVWEDDLSHEFFNPDVRFQFIYATARSPSTKSTCGFSAVSEHSCLFDRSGEGEGCGTPRWSCTGGCAAEEPAPLNK